MTRTNNYQKNQPLTFYHPTYIKQMNVIPQDLLARSLARSSTTTRDTINTNNRNGLVFICVSTREDTPTVDFQTKSIHLS